MTGSWRALRTLGGPVVFAILAVLPIDAPYEVRASLGLLVWMSWWWIGRPVHLAVTAFLPLVVSAVFDIVPVDTVLPAYAQQLVFLLLGANILASLWRRWGLDRRIALVSLLALGTGTRRQILAWFLVAAALSTFLPNTVVAAAMMPIVVAMLRYIGIEDAGRSAFGTALLVAVAWGTSVGGAGTPIGGAPNLLTVQFLETQVIDHEFLFTTWVTRLLPLVLVVAGVALMFMRIAFRPETDRVDATREYLSGELRKLGAMSVQERWGVALFTLATLLAFSRQLYADALPGLTPALAFLTLAVVAFAIRSKGEPLLEWDYAQTHMIWGLIYLFAGGSALGQILSDTGTAQFLAERLVPLASGGGFVAVVVFSFLAMLLTQITSNTAAIAIVVPITISTFQGLGLNPIPFVYIVAVTGNYGLVLPSSSGGCAVAAGYGADLKTMAVWGLGLTVLVWVVLAGAGYLLAQFWPAFGVA